MHYFEDQALHDYRFIRLGADYDRAEVSLELEDLKGSPVTIKIGGVTAVSMTRTEPWGKGSCVVSSDVQYDENNEKIPTIQPDSGDEIEVRTKI